jgi:hypothetical protein
MSEQRLLFETPADADRPRADRGPLAHRGDPATSYEAARRLVQSGKLTGQRKAVMEALLKCDGVTHAELGALMAVHWLIPARRLPELERAGLVRKGEPRLCNIKHSRCTTWWLTEAGGG